jgi:hypothetical protein
MHYPFCKRGQFQLFFYRGQFQLFFSRGQLELFFPHTGMHRLAGTVTLKKDGEDGVEAVRGAAGGESTSPASDDAGPADEGVLGGLGKLFDNIVNRFSDKYLGDD